MKIKQKSWYNDNTKSPLFSIDNHSTAKSLEESLSLREVCEMQSYNAKDEWENNYNGLDYWCSEDIKKGTNIYVLVGDPQRKAFMEGKTLEFDFFFDEKTLNKCLVDDGKNFDTRKLSQLLQVDAQPDFANNCYLYRKNILCFTINKDSRELTSTCLANNQFGSGGANQLYISKKRFLKMYQNGDISFDRKGSYFNAAINEKITKEEYKQIQANKFKRARDCKINKTHHPSKKVAKQGFKTTETYDSKFGNIPNKKEKRNSIEPFVNSFRKSAPQINSHINSKHPKDNSENLPNLN